jgi:hypothetical protein
MGFKGNDEFPLRENANFVIIIAHWFIVCFYMYFAIALAFIVLNIILCSIFLSIDIL